MSRDLIVVDLETTGLDPAIHRILEATAECFRLIAGWRGCK